MPSLRACAGALLLGATAAASLTNTTGTIGASTTFAVDGGANVRWSLLSRATGGDVLELTVAAPVNAYVAVGPSKRQLTGSLLLCGAGPTGAAHCAVWRGDQKDLAPMPDAPAVLVTASATQAGRFAVTARVAARDLNVGNGEQRCAVAVGPYSAAAKAPAGIDERDVFRADFATGSVDLPETTAFGALLAGVGLLTLFAWSLAAAVVHRCTSYVLRPRAQQALKAVGLVLLVAFVLLIGVGAALDHTAALKTAPWGRGAGASASVAACLALLPAVKMLSPGWVFGTTYERLLPYHAMLGLLVFVMSTLHFVLMAADFLPESSDVVASSGYDHSPLLGLLAWVCFSIVVLTSLVPPFRRAVFWVWRLVHCLFIPAYVLMALHIDTPTLAATLGVPAALYFADMVARTVSMVLHGAVVVAATAHPAAGIVELSLKLQRPWPLSPGDFAHIGLQNSSNWALHPLTVAWYDAEAKVATFYVKAAGPWSTKLLDAASAGDLAGTKATWIGPYGSLQVPLGRVPNALLVAGGIGVTPMLAVLQYLGTERARDGTTGGCCGVKVGGGAAVATTVLVWAVRGTAAVDVIRPRLDLAAARAGATVLIYDTAEGKGSGEQDTMARLMVPHAEAGKASVRPGRPDVGRILEQHFPGAAPTAVYCCGPEPLMDACEAAATARPATSVHRETFEM